MTSYNIDQNLSLMIPRVFPQWTNEQHIIDVFHKQDIGKVFKVDIIRTPDEPGRHYPIYQAFIYFSVWYDNDIAFHFQERIFNSVKAAAVQGTGAGQWSARKAQLMAKRYKAAGGGYK